MKLILASASPRRHEILTRAGIPHTVVVSQIDESPYYCDDPAQTVRRLALAKAGAAAALPGMEDCYVLGADTVVYAGGETLGKPRDREDAYRMLQLLSGTSHEVLTGAAVLHGGREECAVVRTEVEFRTLSEEVLQQYLDSGEPYGKAGAYAIQERAGAFVKEVRGDFKNVIGLPLFAVLDILTDVYGEPLSAILGTSSGIGREPV